MSHAIWSAVLIVLLPLVVYANDELLQLQKDPGQWVMQRKNYAATGYSELNQLTVDNVKNLKVAWTFSTGALRGHEGAPLVVRTTMFVHSAFPNHVYALDLTKQPYVIKWNYSPKQDAKAVPVACCDVVHRGLNYVEGKIIMHTLDGQIMALDANTGKELWKVLNADPAKGETMTGAGLVIKDKYIASISGGEFGVRCHVTAYNINTGQQVWRAYSMGPDQELLLAPDFNAANPHYGKAGDGTKTWPGEGWKQGGGCTWGWYSYDPELNLLYYSTGNPGTWNPDQRKGDNKWSMTIFARNPDTGMAKWGYQMTPWDAWDYDGVNENVLTDLNMDGKAVKALVHFDRNGFGYTLDRTNGKVLVAEPYGPVNWASKIDLSTGLPVRNAQYGTTSKKNTEGICPAAIGFKDQQPSAFSPQTKLFYVPTNNICMDYEGVEVKYSAGQPYVGAIVRMFPGPGGNRGRFIAWDPTVGKVKWEIKENLAAYGGALATASGIVFYGTMEGWIKAVDATTGTELWRFKCPSGIIGNPMTYLGPDGKQYVAVLSGIGGWAGAGVALGIGPEDPTAALGAIGAFGDYINISNAGGTLLVFGL